MPPPPGLTKADVANFIEIYGNEEGGQARFAVYVGKPGAKAWCPVKDLAEARRKAGDINSVQSVAIREGQALVPTISFEAWRAEQQAGGSAEPGKPNGKGKGKAKAKGGRAAGPKPPIADDADDIDALVASIEAAASVDGPSDAHRDADAQTGADAQTSADASSGAEQPPTTQEAEEAAAAGRRVRIDGLKARPELNGRCGVARRFDAAKGRYEVAVEGEAEVLVLLRPANLQGAREASVDPPSLDGLHAPLPPLAAVWEVKLSGAFQPYKAEEEQRALEQAWARGESQVQLERGHVVHLAAPMRQVAQHGKLREVRRRALSEAGAL